MTAPFIGARHYHRGRIATVDLLVVHTAEADVAAERVAHYFATTERVASAHSVVDDGGRVDCVAFTDTAFAAPGANADGDQLEVVGFAALDRQAWLTHPGRLEQAARWLAERSRIRGVPLTLLAPAELRANRRGVTTHAAVSAAFHRSTHTDPGRGFPLDLVVARALELATAQPTPALGPRPPARPTRAAPPWPFPSDHYLAAPARDRRCHSGVLGGRDAAAVLSFQRRLRQRGWRVDVDGTLDDGDVAVVRAFQADKRLAVDGRVGSRTWAAAWLAPITR